MQRIFLFVLGIVLFNARLSGQGIEFFHGTWAEALAKATAEDKLIFVDAYAEWCGPCKVMAKNVFTTQKAGNFFNENFICLKIDMEKPENGEFASKFPVSAYPTLMFIGGNNKLVIKQVGAMSVDGLLDFGKKGLAAQMPSVNYEEVYGGGNREPKFLFDYVRWLNRTGKPSLKVTNEYFATQTDLTTPFNLRFLLEGAIEADSRVFDQFVQHRTQITAQEGAGKVDNRIEMACKNTVRKAIEFKQETLLNDAKAKMAKHLPARADAFAYESDTKYFITTKNAAKYLKVVRAYQKNTVKNNAAKLEGLSKDLAKAFPDDVKVLDQAVKWAKMAAETGGLADYYITLASLYKKQGNKQLALAAAQKAKELENGVTNPSLDALIESLQET